jgi:hypothetical protein
VLGKGRKELDIGEISSMDLQSPLTKIRIRMGVKKRQT